MSVIHDDVLSQKHPSPDSTKHTVYCQPSTKLHRTSATTHGLPSGICEGPAEGVSAVLTRSARAYAACPACRADGARDRLRISRTGAHRAGRAGRALAAGAEGTKKSGSAHAEPLSSLHRSQLDSLAAQGKACNTEGQERQRRRFRRLPRGRPRAPHPARIKKVISIWHGSRSTYCP